MLSEFVKRPTAEELWRISFIRVPKVQDTNVKMYRISQAKGQSI